MKQLAQYIFEKLQIKKNSKVKDHRKNWSIETAKDGDIVIDQNDLYFIYKGLNKDIHINNAGDTAIVYHVAGILDERRIISLGPDTGVGALENKKYFRLATEEECDKFFEFLKEKGYKWNDKKLELVKL
jgi:hypothetical protein